MPTVLQANTRDERGYVVAETTYGVAATPLSANIVSFGRLSLGNTPNRVRRSDKTGSRAAARSVNGRFSGQWSLDMSLTGSGTAGTKPPADPLLASLFCNAGVVSAGVKVAYTPGTTYKSISIYSYRDPVTVSQRCCFGAAASSASLTLGQEEARISYSGEAAYVVESDILANLTGNYAALAGGLVTYPAEPTPHVITDGGVLLGFLGSLTIAGSTIASIRSMQLQLQFNNTLRRDTFNARVPDGIIGGMRTVAVTIDLYDDDSAGSTLLRNRALDLTPVAIIGQIGITPGNIYKVTMPDVQLAPVTLADGTDRWTATIGGANATESAIGANDDITIEAL